jgi:O-antigen/teichoic acid export membrane protein
LLQQILRNLFSNWAGLLINIVISFFLAPFVVHELGNTYYGIWAVVGQFTGYLYLLDFGIRESIIRYASRYRALEKGTELETVIQVSFYLYLAIAIFCLLLSAVIALFFTSIFGLDESFRFEVGLTVLFIGGTVSQLFIFNVFNGLLMGYQRYDLFNAVNVLGTVLRAALFVWALSTGFGIVSLAVIQFAITLATGLALAVKSASISRNAGISLNLKMPVWADVVRIRTNVIRYSSYVFLNNIGQKVVFMTDAILIGIFLPVSQVTFYAIAATLVGYLRQLLGSSAQLFNPLISHLSALEEEDSVRYAFTAGTRLLLFISLPVGLTFMILGGGFIELWMGEEYRRLSGQVLLILAAVQIVSAPHQVVSSTLYGLNKHKILAQWRVVEAVTNISLSIALIPYFGILGVAIGTAVPHVLLVTVILPVYGCRQVELPIGQYFLQGYLKPALASIPFALGCVIADRIFPLDSFVSFFAVIGVLCVIYLLISYFVVLTTNERNYVQQRLRSLSARTASPAD